MIMRSHCVIMASAMTGVSVTASRCHGIIEP